MATIEAVATITTKGQFTLPKAIRESMGLSAGSRVHCSVSDDDVLTITRDDEVHGDPALEAFLTLIERDIATGKSLQNLPIELEERMRVLAHRDVDLDEEIEGDVDL